MSLSSTNYKINGNDLNKYFPRCQYYYTDSSNTGNISGTIYINDYSTNDYFVFSSVEKITNITDLMSIGNIIIYNKQNTQFTWYLNRGNSSGSMRIQFMVVYVYTPVSLSITDYTVSSKNLSDYFPICRFYTYNVGGTGSYFSANIYIEDNKTINYTPLISIVTNTTGSSSTYDPWETSSAIQKIIVSAKNTNRFTFSLNKSTGDAVNITLNFMVIYNT